MRNFDTGATRDDDYTKIDPEGFMSPLVIARFSEYMSKHRIQADGKLRDSDNWQKGIPVTAYMKSMWRHFLDVWLMHRGLTPRHNDYCINDEDCNPMEEALSGLLFNVMGYMYEILVGRSTPKQRAPFAAATQHEPWGEQSRECYAQGGHTHVLRDEETRETKLWCYPDRTCDDQHTIEPGHVDVFKTRRP